MTLPNRPPTYDPARGITYVRVSDDGQVEGTSLDDQERQCLAHFQSHGIAVVRSFRDEGISAKTADRPALMQAVDFACTPRNRIKVFMVWKVDRFARNTADHFAIRQKLNAAGVELRSATEPIGDEPNAKLFETIVAGFAEFDNSIRRLRCVNGMRARLRSGIWPFKPPVGYLCRNLARRGAKKSDPDPIHPVVFPLIQRVMKGYARGVYTQSAMVEELIKGDLYALSGVKPSLQLVDRMLTKHLRFYAGVLTDTFGDEPEFYPGLHQPMISMDELRAIEANRSGGSRVALAHVRANEQFPLKGFVRCGHCGRPWTGSASTSRTGKRHPYYHCYNAACAYRGRSHPRDKIETEFCALLRALKPSPDAMAALTEAIALYSREQDQAARSAQAAHAARLLELESKRRRIFDLAEAGAYPPQVARDRVAAVEGEIASENLKAEDGFREPSDPTQLVAQADDVIRTVTSEWPRISKDIRDRFQRMAFPAGISYSKSAGFWNHNPSRIFALEKQFEGANSPGVQFEGEGWNQVIDELRQFADLSAFLGPDHYNRPSHHVAQAS